MTRFVQVGDVALIDPATGNFLPAVHLYIKAEDSKHVPEALDMGIISELAEKFKKARDMEIAEKKRIKKEAKAREKLLQKLLEEKEQGEANQA